MKQQVLFTKKTQTTKWSGLHLLIALVALIAISALHAYPVMVKTSTGKIFELHDVCDSTAIKEIKCSLEDATEWDTGTQIITLNDKELNNEKTAGEYDLASLPATTYLMVTNAPRTGMMMGSSCKTWSPSGNFRKKLPTVTEIKTKVQNPKKKSAKGK